MTRNSNAHMRDGFVLAESDLVDFLSGSTDSAINFSGSADLHTPIHPPQKGSAKNMKRRAFVLNMKKMNKQIKFSKGLLERDVISLCYGSRVSKNNSSAFIRLFHRKKQRCTR